MARVTLEGYQCERCNHVWVPRDKELPKVCPKCKSPYWDRPRLSDSKIKNQKIRKSQIKNRVISNV